MDAQKYGRGRTQQKRQHKHSTYVEIRGVARSEPGFKGVVLVQINPRRMDQVTIFDVSGDIDLANSPEMRKTLLQEMRDRKTPRVIVNMTKVRYIDSSGVASLVEGLKASRDLGLRFILFGLSPSAREVLQLSRLLKIFEVYDNEDQALSS